MIDPKIINKRQYTFIFLSGFILLLLVSVGVYIGRSFRFNTWDLLHPLSFFNTLVNHLKQPGVSKDALLFIFFHTILFVILYISFGIPFLFVFQ